MQESDMGHKNKYKQEVKKIRHCEKKSELIIKTCGGKCSPSFGYGMNLLVLQLASTMHAGGDV